MAEDNGPKGGAGVFAKKLQRQLSRGKEKVLQKFGRTVETRDESFEQCLLNVNDQQTDGIRLYKDLRIYLSSVKGMREASKRLFQSLYDLYETGWEGEEDLGSIVEGEDLLWNDYETKLLDQALRTMESYISQFPDVKVKGLETHTSLLPRNLYAIVKIIQLNSKLEHHLLLLSVQAVEEVNRTKSVFEDINRELKDELPGLYDSRIGCYVTVFTAISNLRDTFFKEMATFNSSLQNVMKDLKNQHPEKEFVVKGLNRTASLKRRSLMSPKSWKASFSDFHQSHSPGKSGTLTRDKSSFRSPRSPGNDESLTSIPAVSPLPLSTGDPFSEARNLDADSTRSEDPTAEKIPESQSRNEITTELAFGSGQKSEKEEEDVKEGEPQSWTSDQQSTTSNKRGEHSAALTEITPKVTNSCNSESVELQSVTMDTPQLTKEGAPEDSGAHGVQNGAATESSDSDVEPTGLVQKEEKLNILEPKDLKNTAV
uniref:BAR domain-containing protein n=1 Tax=Esox lucius TaxID=8010 RepID=A0A6Q2YYZ0_ESOLU